MGRKHHTPEQIIRKLREAEVELAKGQSTEEVARSETERVHDVTGSARRPGALCRRVLATEGRG